MPSSIRLDDLQQKYAENPRRYFAPLANELRKAGDPRAAIALCREHLAQQPGHMSGHVVLAQAHFDLGELDESRRIFDEALELDPENVIALRYLGDIARQRGAPDDARQWYHRILELDPRNPDAHARLEALAGDVAPVPAAAPAPADVLLHDYTPMSADAASLDPGPHGADTFAFDAMLAALPASELDQSPPPHAEVADDEAEPWGEPAFMRAPDGPAEFTAGPAEVGDPDEMLRDLESQFGGEEFTAGFFAEVLEPGAVAGAPGEQVGALAEAGDAATPDEAVAQAGEAADSPLFAGHEGVEMDAVGVAPAGDEAASEPEPATGAWTHEEEPGPDSAVDAEVAEPVEEGADAEPMHTVSAEPAWEAGPAAAEEPIPEASAEWMGEPGAEPMLEPTPEPLSDASYMDTATPAEPGAELAAQAWQLGALGHDAPDTLPGDAERHVPAPEDAPAEVEPMAAAEHSYGMAAGEIAVGTEEADHGEAAFQAEPAGGEPDAWAAEALVPPEERSTAELEEAPAEEERPQDYVPLPGPALAAAEAVEADWFADTVEYPAPAAGPSLAELASRAAAALDYEAHASMPTTAPGEAAEPHASDLAEPTERTDAAAAPTYGEPEEARAEEPADVASDDEPVDLPTEDEPAAPPVGADAFATATMADLYERQGLHERALGVYRQLVARDPDSADLRQRADRLERLVHGAPAEADEETGAAAVQGGAIPTVGGWLRALVTAPVPRRDAAPRAAQVASAPAPSTSLDELLGRPVPAADEQAAGALVAATLSLQHDAAVDAQLDELTQDDPGSLERVLREPTPPPAASLRQGVSFSFEQFFRQAPDAPASGGVSGSPGQPPAAPAPAAATQSADDDLEDFHAWLAGLSKS